MLKGWKMPMQVEIRFSTPLLFPALIVNCLTSV
jgi:hypothetical protein